MCSTNLMIFVSICRSVRENKLAYLESTESVVDGRIILTCQIVYNDEKAMFVY